MDNLRPVIDLTRYHRHSVHGEFALYQSWAYNADQEDFEPALVIIPAYRTSGFQPCVVALSSAFKYDSPKYCVEAARLFARGLGMGDEITRTHTLATLIYDHLLDLLKMPESPTTSILMGEAKLVHGDGTSSTVLIQDHVPLAQA